MISSSLRAALLAGGLSVFILGATPVFAADLPIIVNGSEAQQLVSAGAKIVDVRSAAAYAKGHLPGAVNVPWQALNQSEVDGVRNEFADDATFEKVLSAAGLAYGDTVLIYDTNSLPGRAYVAFEYAGLGARTHVLDGGVAGWSGGLTTEPAKVKPTTFKLTQKNDIRVNKAYVAGKVGAEGAIIIDGRNEDAYADGHIPGATAVPSANLLTKEATLKPQALISTLLTSKGVTRDREVVSYCGSGVAAANNYLALRNLGYTKVVLYDGSWDEWSRDPKAGQEVSLANYGFDAAGKTAGGPAFLDEAGVKAAAADPKSIVVDVRSPSDFAAGHIPGSVNVYWNATLGSDRVLKPADQLKALYAAAGVTPDKRVVLFTRGGFQLTHSFTVLNLLGYRNVDFFTGKFEGWDNGAAKRI